MGSYYKRGVDITEDVILLLEKHGYFIFNTEDAVIDYALDNAGDHTLECHGLVREADALKDIDSDVLKEALQKEGFIVLDKSFGETLIEMYVQYTIRGYIDRNLITELFTQTIQRPD